MSRTIDSLQARLVWLAEQDRRDLAAAERGQLTRREAAARCLRRSRQRERIEVKAFFVWAAMEGNYAAR